MKKSILLVAIIAFFGTLSQAQNVYDADYSSNDTANYPYWIEMMQDHDINVFETVKAFEKYWEHRPDRKGSGYNPFKRWEWYMKHKINPDGSRLAVDHDLKAYLAYQKSNRSATEFSGDWENIGPVLPPASQGSFWGNGRINGIAFHPTNADIFYVGAPSGGLWKTTDGGESWETLTDGQPTLGVSSIVINYDNPFVIYIGSGDRDAGDAAGMGVYKSIDGGETWSQSNNGMGNVTVGRMIQHPTNSDIIFASTSAGIFKTTNAGQSWTRKKTGNCKDILFKPNNPSVIYAITGAKFYKSTDDGENWEQITSGLPSSAYRAVIGVSPEQPEYVYLLATETYAFYGLYRSTDGGISFEERSNSPNIMGRECNGGAGGQAWYDLDIAVDPIDAEIIYGGGINGWKSTDGGQNWFMSSNQLGECGGYPVHADLHVFEYNPIDGRLYVGNDGGIWWTDNGGTTWNRIIDGLAIGQQYKLGQSKLISNHVSTGFQDNGISTYHTDTWIQSDMYADGMETAMDITDTTLGYGCAQYGWLVRRENDSATLLIAGEDVGGINELGNWVTPFCQHETNPNIMFLGYQSMWRTTNLLDDYPSWVKISNGTGELLVVEHSPADENTLYFATAAALYRSDNVVDDVPSFLSLSNYLPESGAVTDIEAHPWKKGVVYITQNKKVFKSENKGLNWEEISGSLPNVTLNDLAYYDRGGFEGLYVASNIGVFFKDEHMDDWVEFSEGLPAAILASEIEIFHHATDPEKDRIRISSFGRGLWGSIPYHYQPMADFESSEVQVPTGCAIDFYDKSIGYPQSWSWTFEGGTPSSSAEANPMTISYDEEGIFEVSLTVTNSEGTDTKTITEYIMVDNNLLPIVNFMAEDTVECSNGNIQFFDLSEACPISWEWTFDPDEVTYQNGTDKYSQNPLVKFNEIDVYSVSLMVANSVGESELSKENYISIGGAFIPFYEDFQGGTLNSKGWQINNPDGKKTWTTTTLGEGNYQVVWMNFFDYQKMNDRDYLSSPVLNFQGFGSVDMTFKYAYAQRFTQKDSLIVNVSADCGETWTRVYAGGPDGEGAFETAEPTESFFNPQTSDEWCGSGYGAICPIINLNEWAGQSNIMIQFESFNNYGNNLYLTDVDISTTVGVYDETEKQTESFIFYPNPTTGQLNVVNLLKGSCKLQILDIHGRAIRNVQFDDKHFKLDVTNLDKGIYFITYTNGEITNTKKLVIN